MEVAFPVVVCHDPVVVFRVEVIPYVGAFWILPSFLEVVGVVVVNQAVLGLWAACCVVETEAACLVVGVSCWKGV